MKMLSAFYSRMDSPLGPIWLAATSAGQLCTVGLGPKQPEDFFAWISQHLPDMNLREDRGELMPAQAQFDEYFAGTRQDFDLPLHVQGTPFQKRVWDQLMQIPYASTVTYGEVARRIGQPKASRAVGAAVGANPLPIVIPCHRVVGANGKLVGYGGGLGNKVILLDIERNYGAPSHRHA